MYVRYRTQPVKEFTICVTDNVQHPKHLRVLDNQRLFSNSVESQISTMVPPDSTSWLEKLSRRSKVLVTFDDSKWDLAVIAKVSYKLAKTDTKLLKAKGVEVKVDDEVPFRIKLKSGAFRPVLSVHALREFSPKNIVRCRADPSLLDILGLAEEEFHEIFLLAVKVRNVKAVMWMQENVQFTNSFDGMELLTKALHFEQASMLPAIQDQPIDTLFLAELSDLLSWLFTTYKVGYEDFKDSLQRTPEHVAVLRGDLILLEYAFARGDPPNPLDTFHMSPFMYAARKGNVHILGMYRQAVLNDDQKWQGGALTQTNKQLQSCWDLAQGESTKEVLNEISIHLELVEFQPKRKLWDSEILAMEAEFIRKLDDDSSPTVLEAAIQEAQVKSKMYLAECPRWSEC